MEPDAALLRKADVGELPSSQPVLVSTPRPEQLVEERPQEHPAEPECAAPPTRRRGPAGRLRGQWRGGGGSTPAGRVAGAVAVAVASIATGQGDPSRPARCGTRRPTGVAPCGLGLIGPGAARRSPRPPAARSIRPPRRGAAVTAIRGYIAAIRVEL